jgi:putative lipoprotein
LSRKIKLFLPAVVVLCGSVSVLYSQTAEKAGVPDRWLGRDKLAHFTVSLAAVGFANHWLAAENAETPVRARNTAVALSLSLGVIKEFHDGAHRGNRFSFKDLAADILGAAVGTALFTIN